MLWFFFALTSALFSSIKQMLHRKILFHADPYAYAFLENVLIFFIFVPLAFMHWALPTETTAWVLLAIGGILWTFVAVVVMYSYKFTQVSLRAPVAESRMLWTLIFAAIFLSEAITAQKIVGVLIVFLGISIVSYKRDLPFGSFKEKGVQFTLAVAFLLALTAIVDKKALSYFEPNVYAMFVYIIPAILIGIFAFKRVRKDAPIIIRTQHWPLLAAFILGAASYFFQIHAYDLADVSVVYPILRLSTLFTVIGGIIFFHERKHIARKLIATAVVVLGVLMVSGYYTLF
jgi:uncharacterized membrane protein